MLSESESKQIVKMLDLLLILGDSDYAIFLIPNSEADMIRKRRLNRNISLDLINDLEITVSHLIDSHLPCFELSGKKIKLYKDNLSTYGLYSMTILFTLTSGRICSVLLFKSTKFNFTQNIAILTPPIHMLVRIIDSIPSMSDSTTYSGPALFSSFNFHEKSHY